jgi:ATP-binding cassette, subfamily B, multidrug efflux pump
MFKLFARFRKRDWVSIAIIIGLTVIQVWCVMLMTDYIKFIIQSITYLSYQQDPSQLGNTFLTMYNQAGGSWSTVDAVVQASGATLGMSQKLIDTVHAIASATIQDVYFNVGMMILVTLGYMGAQTLISVLASAVAASFATSLRHDINKKVSSFSLANIHGFSTPSLITRASNDIEQVQMAILLTMRMVFAAPVTAIWAICKIQASSTELTITTAVAVVLLIIGLLLIMMMVMPKFKVSQKYVDKLNEISRENLTGIRVVRAYNGERYQERKFKTANDDLTHLNTFTGRVIGALSPLMTILMDGVSLAIYIVGSYLINNKTLDYATVTSFMTLATQIVMAFMMLLMMFILWPRASVSAKRINEVLEAKDSIQDPVEEKPFTEKGTLRFDDVSFRYPDAKENIVEHVSFKATAGQTVAVVGATGCGKSSLINLIARLYDCTQGSISVDGVNVKDLSQKKLHSVIGFVPQKGVLFTGTIASNLAFGNGSLSKDEMVEVSKIACADEFVSQMEKGYDSPVSQGGTNVSGGQRQRLCIARALAIHPEILVFDDSFSALDFKTDLQVRENIKKAYPETTKVIVAQRIGTIMDADEILVLEDGKVVGQGRHQDLLKSCPTYLAIALSQLSKEELGL